MNTVAATPATLWQPLDAWAPAARPRALWPYLAEAGSLTERLRSRDTGFQVQLLAHGHTTLSEEDTALLEAKPEEAGYVRQVYLCGGDERPWVYARSLTAGPSENWLKELGEHPLGDRVFANPRAGRSPIVVAQLDAHHVLHKEALAHLSPQERAPAAGPLWARRSRLTVEAAHILIYEVFLPGLES
ncbi:MAG TPA: chorismate lyase [Gammaproteobacteria bacterium]|jgi:chorismate--pyruvate lyase